MSTGIGFKQTLNDANLIYSNEKKLNWNNFKTLISKYIYNMILSLIDGSCNLPSSLKYFLTTNHHTVPQPQTNLPLLNPKTLSLTFFRDEICSVLHR
jgi:hypothetical protein